MKWSVLLLFAPPVGLVAAFQRFIDSVYATITYAAFAKDSALIMTSTSSLVVGMAIATAGLVVMIYLFSVALIFLKPGSVTVLGP